MRECAVCGERDFEEHDGHYFCSTCNTQSQEVRVTVADEENFENFRRSGLIRETATPKQSQKRISDHGRPWSVYEAYQIIIQHQVNALIKLGAQESLKEVVFKIWVNYLSRLGVAFSKTAVNNVKYERQRELFPSTTDHPEITNVLGKRSRKKTLGPSAKKIQKQVEKDETSKAIRDEEFYAEDNPLNDSEDVETGSKTGGWSSSEEDGCERRWGRYRKSLKYNAVEKVRMTSTVAVCFLGLMHTNPLITATDLIRWICTGKIPYLGVKAILPEDMKFSLNDWKLFGLGSPPTLEQLRHTAGTIAYYIGLKNFPEFPIDDLINKYIIQLDLPAEFHGYAINVYKCMQIQLHYIPSANQKMTIYWEGVAMAYIVITLKIFFGFDDTNEILISEYSKELSEISECAKPLFVWTDWVQHMKNRMQIDQQNSKSDRGRTFTHLRHRIELTEHKGRERKLKKSFRESLAKPFYELSERWKLSDSSSAQSSTFSQLPHGNTSEDVPIDFDMNTLEEVDDPLDISPQDDNSRENDRSKPNSQTVPNNENDGVNKEIRAVSDHFRKSTVQHILHPDTYLADIQNKMQTDDHETDNATGGPNFSLSEIIINDFYNGSQTQAKRRRKERKEHSSQNNSLRNLDILDEADSAINDNIEKYQVVIEKLKDVKKNLQLSLDFETREMCLSYDWLLKICSHVLQGEMTQLRDMIYKLEVMFFSEEDDDYLSKSGKYHRMKLRTDSQYFANTLLQM